MAKVGEIMYSADRITIRSLGSEHHNNNKVLVKILILIVPIITLLLIMSIPVLEAATANPNSVVQDISTGDGQILTFRDISNTNNVSATVSLDEPPQGYTLSDTPTITVTDPEANLRPDTINNVFVNVTSTSDMKGVLVTLGETGADTGAFKGTFSFTPGPSSGNSLHIESGDRINVSYDASHIRMKEILNGVLQNGTAVITDYNIPTSCGNIVDNTCTAVNPFGDFIPLFTPVSGAANVTIGGGARLDPNAVSTVILSYANAKLDSQPLDSLQVWEWTPAYGWQALDSSGGGIDTVKKTVSAQTTTRGIPLNSSGIFVLGESCHCQVGGGAGGIRHSSGGVIISTVGHIVGASSSGILCNKATPTKSILWPPNHKFVSIGILNVKERQSGYLAAITIIKIMQDEPVNSVGSRNTAPDGWGVGTSTAYVRAERQDANDGRVYHINFIAKDGKQASNSATCSGQVLVSVPHDQAHSAVDGGPRYDSTVLLLSNTKVKMRTTSTVPASQSTLPRTGSVVSTPTSNVNNNNNNNNNSNSNGGISETPGSPIMQQQQQQKYPYLYHYPYLYPYQRPYLYQYAPQTSNPYTTYQQQLQEPVAVAGVSQTVYENTTVILDGRRSYDPNGGVSIVAYQWTQLPIGIPVLLSGANTPTPTFTAPIINTDNTVLGFSLRVMDNHGVVSANPAIVYVMIKHNPSIGPTTSPNANQPQQQQQQHIQPFGPNNFLPTPSRPNSHQPQIGSFRP
jgi:hypothetical protein